MQLKKIILVLLVIVLVFSYMTIDAASYSLKHKEALGYYLDGKSIIFIYAPSIRRWKNPKAVFVAGSFNGWSVTGEWQLNKNNKTGNWELGKSYDEVRAPGNSGLPEFKFVVDNNKWEGPMENHPKGYKYLNHFVVLLDGISPRTVIKREKKSKIIITKYKTDEDLSNFREINFGNIADNILYRSYNPFIPSRPLHPKEKDRLAMVQEFMKANGIKSVINLSDKKKDFTKRSVPAYYKNIMDNDNVLFVETGYSTVYYGAGTDEFNELFSKIFDFIIKKAPPFLIHCRLGTDRTGVVAAVLEALMGATPEEVVMDYERSNNMGIGEYRNRALIEYTLSTMIGESIYTTTDLARGIKNYFIDNAHIDESKVKQVCKKLSDK